MKELIVDVPHYKKLQIRHVVLDYNGTLAEDGELKEEAKLLLNDLVLHYEVHVITSDTFGSVKEQLDSFDVGIRVLESDDHTGEKAAYIEELGSQHCVAVGNGNNDRDMLKKALLGIALIGDEGCNTQTLLSSDIVCHSIADALKLLLNEKRLIATLRK